MVKRTEYENVKYEIPFKEVRKGISSTYIFIYNER